MTLTRKASRSAMTLVELLVVMVIMLILATIVVAFAPGFQDAQKVARGADQLQMWLVSARQTAKSARVPSGLRLFINNGKVNELQYIQQPPVFTVPFAVPAQPALQQPPTALLSITTPPPGTVSTAKLNFPPVTTPGTASTLGPGQLPGDFSGGQGALSPQQLWPVQPGDFLVIHGTICSVGAFGATDPVFKTLANQFTLSTPLGGNLGNIPATSDYYFVRAARPLTGESTLKLPQDVVIDMTKSIPTGAASGAGAFDIMFSPSGEVIAGTFSSAAVGTNSALNNKIIFWILDPTKPAGNTQDTLIAVDIRTGLIAAQPVNVGGADLYLFTKDGRTSGL
jgi:prepilin-type N-terminal cleavage/methylation domain-containing protein